MEDGKQKNVVLYFFTAYTGDQDQFIPTTEGKISSFSLKAQCIEVFKVPVLSELDKIGQEKDRKGKRKKKEAA